jgi:LmbE family N-acetylglucosaminyl deacetylase
MVLAPHPDDEALATGGVLLWAARRGADIRILFVTDGGNNPWAQRWTERRWCLSQADRRRWGVRRRREALAALRHLGVPPESARFLGFQDQHVTEEVTADLARTVGMLVEEIDRWRPTLLFAPSLDDHHPDHGATAVLAGLALARCRVRPRVFYSRIHPEARSAVHARSIYMVLSALERDRKRRAVLCHTSQLGLRRRQLLEFVEMPERFEEDAPSTTGCSRRHPLQVLGAPPGDIRFAIRRSVRVAIGGAALLLVVPLADEDVMLRMNLDRLRARSVRLVGSGRGCDGEMTTYRRGTDQIVTISASALGNAECGLAKIDMSRERHMGFFDPWPWLSFNLPRRS